MRSRGFFMGRSWQRNLDGNLRAHSRFGLNIQSSLHRPYALAHVDETQTKMVSVNLLEIESHPAVTDCQGNFLAVAGQFELNAGGMSMLQHIRQALLGDPI